MPKAQKRRKAPAKVNTAQSRITGAQHSTSSTRNGSATPVSKASANGTNATLAIAVFSLLQFLAHKN
jgi:hypothetical protein